MFIKLIFSMTIVYVVGGITTCIELKTAEDFNHAAVTGLCVGFIAAFAVNLWLALFRPESKL